MYKYSQILEPIIFSASATFASQILLTLSNISLFCYSYKYFTFKVQILLMLGTHSPSMQQRSLCVVKMSCVTCPRVTCDAMSRVTCGYRPCVVHCVRLSLVWPPICNNIVAARTHHHLHHTLHIHQWSSYCVITFANIEGIYLSK